ncbi:hypothetical protein D3C80_1548220 [compost metagenome]
MLRICIQVAKCCQHRLRVWLGVFYVVHGNNGLHVLEQIKHLQRSKSSRPNLSSDNTQLDPASQQLVHRLIHTRKGCNQLIMVSVVISTVRQFKYTCIHQPGEGANLLLQRCPHMRNNLLPA